MSLNSTVSGWSAEKRAAAFVQQVPSQVSDKSVDVLYDLVLELLEEAYDIGYTDAEEAYDGS